TALCGRKVLAPDGHDARAAGRESQNHATCGTLRVIAATRLLPKPLLLLAFPARRSLFFHLRRGSAANLSSGIPGLSRSAQSPASPHGEYLAWIDNFLSAKPETESSPVLLPISRNSSRTI